MYEKEVTLSESERSAMVYECECCGERYSIHPHTHRFSVIELEVGDAVVVSCDDCMAEGASPLGSVIHICGDGDGLGLGGNEPILGRLTAEDADRAVDELRGGPDERKEANGGA